MALTPKQLAEYLRGIEGDLSTSSNGTLAAAKAYQRIIDRAAIAAKMLEAFAEQN